MSIVIVGGNERMVCQYECLCKNHGCRAKIFVNERGNVKKKFGSPDLLILFTNTASHKMVKSATEEAKKCGIPIARVHNNSSFALCQVLEEYCHA